MWRKQEETKPSSAVSEVPPSPRMEPARSVAGLTAEVVQPSGGMVTSSLLINGEIRGDDDLYIDGVVRGTIHLGGRVTIGPHGQILADVEAREVVVRGKVKGALRASERVEIGRTGETNGEIVTPRIAVEDGAQLHGKVEVTRAKDTGSVRVMENSSGAKGGQSVAMTARGDLAN